MKWEPKAGKLVNRIFLFLFYSKAISMKKLPHTSWLSSLVNSQKSVFHCFPWIVRMKHKLLKAKAEGGALFMRERERERERCGE
jgi:hypothetical protein